MKQVSPLPIRWASVPVAAVATTALLLLLILLGPVAPAPAHHISKSCRDVAFTPNSDDVASDIRAKRLSCSYARDFIRDFDAAPAQRYAGYACTWRSVENPDSLPHTRFRCSRGARVMSWKRY